MGNLFVAGRGRGSQSGFTLMELMIVVLILGILMAIAYPSYTRHMIKARRATAAGCLQERAQLLERYYTTHMSYSGAGAPAQCDGVQNFYTIGWTGGTAPSARAFSVSAVPQAAQASDAECGTLTLDQAGARTVSGSGSAEQCW